jgi:Transposase DDE domain
LGKTRRDGTFQGEEFRWDEQRNEYQCPAGHAMRSDWRAYANPRTHITKADTIIYRSSQPNCSGCSMKERCCPNMPFRKIARSIHEDARDVARKLSTTSEYRQSRRDRKKVEMLFAHLKRILKLDRLRLRGSSGAQDEFLLAETPQNLRRMARRLASRDEAMIGTAV